MVFMARVHPRKPGVGSLQCREIPWCLFPPMVVMGELSAIHSWSSAFLLARSWWRCPSDLQDWHGCLCGEPRQLHVVFLQAQFECKLQSDSTYLHSLESPNAHSYHQGWISCLRPDFKCYEETGIRFQWRYQRHWCCALNQEMLIWKIQQYSVEELSH